MQIILQNVPGNVEQQLVARAKVEGKTVGEIAIDLLSKAVNNAPQLRRDLSFMRMSEADAREIESAHQDFEKIDPEVWK